MELAAFVALFHGVEIGEEAAGEGGQFVLALLVPLLQPLGHQDRALVRGNARGQCESHQLAGARGRAKAHSRVLGISLGHPHVIRVGCDGGRDVVGTLGWGGRAHRFSRFT